MGIVKGYFLGEVNLAVPQSLAQYFEEDEEGQITLRLVTKGEHAAFFVRDDEDEQGRVTYSARFDYPVGQSCSLMTQGGNTFATWKLHDNGDAEMTYAQH